MEASGALDQLCLAACEPGISEPGEPSTAAEIKVMEVDAYASVADLIQAAITANNGAATLKEVYDVCERHGRIAYRRAGGSRLITANEHWKSQIRHALYTGSRFKRVPSNTEYWQLANPDYANPAELVRVLVRTDDATSNIYASLTLSPSGTGSGTIMYTTGHLEMQHRQAVGGFPAIQHLVGAPRLPKIVRSKGAKRSLANDDEEDIEGMCDTADLDGSVSRRGISNLRRLPRRCSDDHPSDNYSTQQSDEEIKELLPRPRPSRPKPINTAPFSRPLPHPAPYHARPRHTYQFQYRNPPSGNSDELTSLRWGSTGLRSSVLVADGVSFSLGRGTPGANARRILLNRDRNKTPSAEADSPPMNANKASRKGANGMAVTKEIGMGRDPRTNGAIAAACGISPPSKRRATNPAEKHQQSGTRAHLEATPTLDKDELAHITPPVLTQQLTAALHQLQEAAAAKNSGSMQVGAGEGWPSMMMPAAMSLAPMQVPGMAPAMLPAMLPFLPAMMAAAAPYLNNHEAQHQLLQQMQSAMLNSGVAHEGASRMQQQQHQR